MQTQNSLITREIIMKKTIAILSLLCVASNFGFEHVSKRKIALADESSAKRFGLSDFLNYPKIENVPFEVVREAYGHMYDLKEGNLYLWRSIRDRMLLDSTYDDPSLKPIVERYAIAVISLKHEQGITLEQARDNVHRDVNKLGYIIYGLPHRTSTAKWNAVKENIKKEFSSGCQLQSKK